MRPPLIGLHMWAACRAETLFIPALLRWLPIVVLRLEQLAHAAGCVLHEAACQSRVFKLLLQIPLYGRRRTSPCG